MSCCGFRHRGVHRCKLRDYSAPSPLHIEPSLTSRRTRCGRSPNLGTLRRPFQQVGETRSSRDPVLTLGPVLTAVDHQDAIRRDSTTRLCDQACLDVGREGRVLHVEPQLDGCRDLVDVLAPRSRRAHEALCQLVCVNRHRLGELDHGWWCMPGGYCAPRSSLTIRSRSRAYSVVPTSVGTVQALVLNNGVVASVSRPSGVNRTSDRSPSSSIRITFPSA